MGRRCRCLPRRAWGVASEVGLARTGRASTCHEGWGNKQRRKEAEPQELLSAPLPRDSPARVAEKDGVALLTGSHLPRSQSPSRSERLQALCMCRTYHIPEPTPPPPLQCSPHHHPPVVALYQYCNCASSLPSPLHSPTSHARHHPPCSQPQRAGAGECQNTTQVGSGKLHSSAVQTPTLHHHAAPVQTQSRVRRKPNPSHATIRQHGRRRVMIGTVCRTTSTPLSPLGPPMRQPLTSHAPSPRPRRATPPAVLLLEPG